MAEVEDELPVIKAVMPKLARRRIIASLKQGPTGGLKRGGVRVAHDVVGSMMNPSPCSSNKEG
jgi:hypothetical protein